MSATPEEVMSASVLTRIAVAFLAFTCADCSTPTTSTAMWKSPYYTGGPKTNLLVIGGRMNETNRHIVEDALVSALSSHGVRATASYAVFAGPPPDLETARQKVQAGGYDGALVSTMHGIKERTTIEPGVAYGGPFWGGYYGGWGDAAAAGYVETDSFVKFETTLWDPQGDGKMIWSDVTQTENPSSASNFASSLVKHLIPAMENAGLLPPAQGAPISLGPQPGISPTMQAASH
jgi:hypothetical protein